MILDVNEIQKILPHRYPFLFVDGIVEMDEDGLRVTALGAPLLRVVAMRFDAHFAPGAKERRHAMSV